MGRKRQDFTSSVEMYNSGSSIQEVADAAGITRQAMHVALRRRGVVFRPQLRFGSDNHFYRHGRGYDLRVAQMLSKAIQKGRLIPQPCEICAEPKTDGHHDDYNKPLEVRWLCDPHHREWHQNHTPIYRTIDLPPMPKKQICSMGGKASRKNKAVA